MGANAETIWQVPAYLPYLQPPLTDEAVAEAERSIGYTLPAEYLKLLRKQNGGYIRFSLPKMVHDWIAGIGPHFPSLTGFDWDECQDDVSFQPHGLVPFDGDGHWHLCLDYRQNSVAPAVTYVNVECDRESRIADSFSDYLDKLQIDASDEFILVGAEIGKLKADLSLLLGVAFDPPDTWAHGYPTHRARCGGKDDPEWIWITPNTVPRGFVRPDDDRFAELKDLLPGYASRYPEAPADSYILSATEGVRSKVIEACTRSQVSVHALLEYVNGS